MAVQLRALFLLAVVLLPLFVVSVNSMTAEMDIELLESLTEEENDEKDGEDLVYFMSVNFSFDVTDVSLEEKRKCLGKVAFVHDQSNLAYKVPTPPPELS